jgi:hypothetical protein
VRIVPAELVETYSTPGPGFGIVCTDDYVCLRCQGVKALLILWLVEIQDHAAFTEVGLHEWQAQAFLTGIDKGHKVSAGIASGGLDFYDIGTEVPQDTADIGAEWCGNVQNAKTFEGSQRLVMIGGYHGHSI